MPEPSQDRRPAATPMPFMRHGPGMGIPGEIKRAKDVKATLKRLWGYLRRQKAAIVATASMVFFTVILTVCGPYLVVRAIDGFILKHDLAGLARISLLLLGVYAIVGNEVLAFAHGGSFPADRSRDPSRSLYTTAKLPSEVL